MYILNITLQKKLNKISKKMRNSLIKERILMHIRKMSISRYKFCTNTGITRGVLDVSSGTSEENIAKYLAYYPQVNPDWLLTGKEPMFRDQQRGEITSPADPELKTLREAMERATQEAKEASERAEEAWRQLAEAHQEITQLTREIVQLTEVVADLKATNTELNKQLDPEEQLKYKREQEDRSPTKQ